MGTSFVRLIFVTPTIGWAIAAPNLPSSDRALFVSRTRTPMIGSKAGSAGSSTLQYTTSRRLAFGPVAFVPPAPAARVRHTRSSRGFPVHPYSNSTNGAVIDPAARTEVAHADDAHSTQHERKAGSSRCGILYPSPPIS